MLVDSLNSEVGQLENLRDGLISRTVQGDEVLLIANADGLVSGPVVFYHLTANCSGARQLPNVNGPGFMFMGQAFGPYVVYSRVVDPGGTASARQPQAMETVVPGEDLSAPPNPAACLPLEDAGLISMGPAVIASDPAIGALTPPFSVR